ncbi:MAG TPA: rhomboid family intramembrane serine protease [Pirellulaceae bacterium]|nr:rhomboid family intramembrane serine protease [Pirellulaceae bacterium]HMO92643.1 rhomboid family intramembrane serine protease [Pirellulaceae bacterium]HMP70209.1 rhomboid family intramembrane serine protease [Pirellulaceae bacterium]
MPISDRSYYRDDDDYDPSQSYGSMRGPNAPRSIVITLILVNAAIFLVDAFTPEVFVGGGTRWLSWMMSLKVDGQGTFAEKEVAFWQLPYWNLWQIATYGFAHASITSDTGIMHVLFNMLGLFIFGRSLEERYGRHEFLRFYVAALLFAGVVSYFFISLMGKTSFLVGASGAVSAVIILFVLLYPHRTILIFGIIPAPAWVLGILLIGSDILQGLRPSSQVGWYAHLAGALFAFLYFRLGWNLSWVRFDWLTDRMSGKPRLKVHRGKSSEDKLQEEADRILDKLHREGEASLNRKERSTLEKYSRMIRKKNHEP